MKKTLYVVSGIVALTIAGAVIAQERGKGHGMLEKFDTDNNGTIDKAEFDASRDARFGDIDKNNDGITFAEYEAKAAADRAAKEARMAAKRAERMKKRFEKMDANNDGVISKAEYNAASDKMFSRMDRNEDGILNDRRGGRGHKHKQDRRG